jgi:two-component system NtrC family sensor kinase
MTGKPSVLLIEDSDTQALLLADMLEGGGMSVARTASAEEGLEHLRSHRPDLVVVDYHLPGMQGTEFCRLMRASSATATIPLLILTGDTESEVERQGLESGADDHVAKSSDRDVLLARIELLLRRAAARHPEGARDATFFRAQQILAVDDSPTYLALIEEELRREGYGVTAVADGVAALDAVTAKQIDCAVVDLVMPGMDGIELCRRIAAHRGSGKAELPILIVTSHASKEKMMEALDAGADDFVEKSSDSTVLKARIRALLRRKSLHEEQERIQGALRDQQVELARERAERKAAQARADLAERLEAANRELEVANRELRDAHVQLLQSAKMASLGGLVAGIAHEVNNPLAFSISHLGTIASALDAVAAEAEGGLTTAGQAKLDKARQRAGDVAEGLARVRDLVTKLRTFSRLDEGSFKQADIRECIESALTFLGHRLGHGISVRATYADDNSLYCAPGLLNQVVLNLLTNAVDAVGARGHVRITTSRDANTFRLSVADSGPGVSDELRERVFEPFFTTKDVGAGTGMGLAISYRIVERHRGRIEIGRSAEGGAEFTVHIPLNLAEADNAAA